MIARSWEDFLQRNDAPGLSSLTEVDGDLVFPDMPLHVYANAGTAFDFARLVELAKSGLPAWEDLPGLERSLQGLERARVEDLEDWLQSLGLDALAFPANGDVARSDLFSHEGHMEEALRNGVLFSNGNRAIRHLGIPTVSLPMGRMADIGMPVNLTLAGPAYSDGKLIEIARVYEAQRAPRPIPPLTPSLPSSGVPHRARSSAACEPPRLAVEADVALREDRLQLDCAISAVLTADDTDPVVEAWVDGRALRVECTVSGAWTASGRISASTTRLEARALLVVRVSSAEGPPAAHIEELQLPSD